MKLPTYFISHGGGPWPLMPAALAELQKTASWLGSFPKSLIEKPKAILSISAHWEENEFTVSTSEHPAMIYDYSGFPAHTYQLKYPASGSSHVAGRVKNLLNEAGIPNRSDASRGFDHGTFVPLMLMYPLADIPVISMSIKNNYHPEEHFKMGQALAPLREEGILIVGSGLSYHNMRGFGRPGSDEVSKQFGNWLHKTIAKSDPLERLQDLKNWEMAPAARLAHPEEDHLIPLMAVVGAAGTDPGKLALLDHAMNVDMANYQFGD